jgi:spoIIIJ-associated protein
VTETSTSSDLDPTAPADGSAPATDAPDDVAAGAAAADVSGSSEGDGGDGGAPAPARRSLTERLEREGEIAADYLERLLDVTDLDGDLDVDIDGDRAAVAIVDSEEGRVPRRLVGRDGEVLEALQELTRLAVLASTGERSRLMLDVAGHRAARREELITQAQQAVAEVGSSGAPVTLPPMSPFERKVVHDAIAEAGLRSESEGVEPARCVVVLPA